MFTAVTQNWITLRPKKIKTVNFTLSRDFTRACEYGNITKVREILASDELIDIDLQTTFGYTALHWAAARGYESIARILVSQHADPNVTDNYGYTPLMRALKKKKHALARILISAGSDVSIRAGDRTTALLWAAKINSSEIAELILQQEGPTPWINYQDKYGYTALAWACKKNNTKMAKCILSNHRRKGLFICQGDRKSVSVPRTDSDGAADLAEKLENDCSMGIVHSRQADPNTIAMDATTPLSWAIATNNVETTTALIRCGVNTDLLSEGRSSRKSVARRPWCRKGFYKRHIWETIVRNHRFGLAHALLRNGNNPDRHIPAGGHESNRRVKNDNINPKKIFSRQTIPPLFLACIYNITDMALLLLNYGADPNIDFLNVRPMMYAVLNSNVSIIKGLLEHGADMNAPGPDGFFTPFLKAVVLCRYDVIDLFLEHQTDKQQITEALFMILCTAYKTGKNRYLKCYQWFLQKDVNISQCFSKVVESSKFTAGSFEPILLRLIRAGLCTFDLCKFCLKNHFWVCTDLILKACPSLVHETSLVHDYVKRHREDTSGYFTDIIAFLNNAKENVASLQVLSAAKVRCVLYSTGGGHSILPRIKRLPPNVLKKVAGKLTLAEFGHGIVPECPPTRRVQTRPGNVTSLAYWGLDPDYNNDLEYVTKLITDSLSAENELDPLVSLLTDLKDACPGVAVSDYSHDKKLPLTENLLRLDRAYHVITWEKRQSMGTTDNLSNDTHKQNDGNTSCEMPEAIKLTARTIYRIVLAILQKIKLQHGLDFTLLPCGSAHVGNKVGSYDELDFILLWNIKIEDLEEVLSTSWESYSSSNFYVTYKMPDGLPNTCNIKTVLFNIMCPFVQQLQKDLLHSNVSIEAFFSYVHGPGLCLNLTWTCRADHKHDISVDLTPTLILPDQKLGEFWGKRSSKGIEECELIDFDYVVAQLREAPVALVPADGIIKQIADGMSSSPWRLSMNICDWRLFQLLDDISPNIRSGYRLLKIFRDLRLLKAVKANSEIIHFEGCLRESQLVSSYVLENIILMEVEKHPNPKDWDDGQLEQRLVSCLKVVFDGVFRSFARGNHEYTHLNHLYYLNDFQSEYVNECLRSDISALVNILQEPWRQISLKEDVRKSVSADCVLVMILPSQNIKDRNNSQTIKNRNMPQRLKKIAKTRKFKTRNKSRIDEDPGDEFKLTLKKIDKALLRFDNENLRSQLKIGCHEDILLYQPGTADHGTDLLSKCHVSMWNKYYDCIGSIDRSSVSQITNTIP